ncbi:sodium:proton antiporter [Geothrix sp. SG200]|uniref:sodium:proton antiporter n=1 Tax=Geothrix sp. SG200 TaxID=2922865 RepID=UPI001FACC21C
MPLAALTPPAGDLGLEAFRRLGPWSSALGFAPFSLLLAAIAVLPLVPKVAGWWGRLPNKWALALLCSVAGAGFHYTVAGDPARLLDTLLDYLAFIALLSSLYVVSGGIHISGAFSGLPWLNTVFLALGGVLANVMGTTGASMVLIRPLLHANRRRRHKVHVVVFFIFVVSNTGGLLTPLGDPPLYLGFLKGVPFAWTLGLLPQWALLQGLLLTIFHFLDEIVFHREELEVKHALVEDLRQAERPLHVQGKANVGLLLGILAVVIGAGHWLLPALQARWGEAHAALLGKAVQILAFGGITGLALWLKASPAGGVPFRRNHFSFEPLEEVAAVFLGIFGAMLPALDLLQARAADLPLHSPWQFFWMTGVLSSFLDNAPTYLTFASLAAVKADAAGGSLGALAHASPLLLKAVACGAVFMGANTYIGNGPNFMVKAIAERSGLEMPSFLAYVGWSAAVLLPLFLVETLVFFR